MFISGGPLCYELNGVESSYHIVDLSWLQNIFPIEKYAARHHKEAGKVEAVIKLPINSYAPHLSQIRRH